MKTFSVTFTVVFLAGAAFAGDLPQSTPMADSNRFQAPKPKEGFRYPDCFCTDGTGERIEMGQTTCLSIGSQSFTARCSMSLNNPMWRRVADGCPSV